MSGFYLFFEAILRRFKALLLLAVLMGLGVGAVGYFAGSNNSARDAQRILWTRTYVQEIVEVGSPESLGLGPCPGGIQRGISGGGSGGPLRRGARLGHRGLDPAAG